jgi:hypothetical protein
MVYIELSNFLYDKMNRINMLYVVGTKNPYLDKEIYYSIFIDNELELSDIKEYIISKQK